MSLDARATLRYRLFLLLGWALALVPLVYFHNGLVTEYYFSKTVWANLFIPLPLLIWWGVGLRDGEWSLPKSRTLLPLVLLCAWGLISLSWTSNPYKGWEYIGRVGVAPLAFFSVLWLVRGEKEVLGLVRLGIWAMTLVAVYGFFQWVEVFYLPVDQYGDKDPSTTIGLTNFVVEYMMIYLLAAPLFLLIDQRRWSRALLLFAAAAILLYVVISRNRAGMLGFLAEVGVLVVVLVWVAVRHRERFGLTPRRVLAAAGAIVVAIGVLLGGTTVGGRVTERFLSMFNEAAVEQDHETSALETFVARIRRDSSIEFRLETWHQSLRYMFPDAPIRGVGLANLEVEFPRHYTPFLEKMTISANTRVVRAHNEYVQLITDLGIVGYLLFFWMAAQLVRNMVEAFRRIHGRRDFAIWLILHLGFFGFAVEAFFAFPLHIPSSAIWFFVAMGLSEVWLRDLRAREAGVPAEQVGFHPIGLDLPWRRVTAWALMFAAVAGVLWMEVFAYNAMVGEVRNKEARVLKRFQRWREAEILLTEAIRHYPWMEGYYYDRAVVYMQQGRNEEALKDLRMTATLVPYYAMGRRQIGQLAAQLGRTELAVEEFKATMLVYKQQRAQLTELIARTAIQGRRPELALPVLSEAIDEYGITSPTLLRLLADTHAMMGKLDDALAQYDKLRAMGAWDDDLQVGHAFLLQRQGRLDEAEESLRQILAVTPSNAHANYFMALVKAGQGRGKAALGHLQSAVALDPELRQRARGDKTFAESPEIKAWLERR
jgi:O-antigen ligase/tetratricopeptide (TPR) repeat protein